MAIQFVTPPRAREKKIVGNKICGEIEIETYGGLTTDEVDTVSRLTRETTSAYVMAAELSQKIASAELIKEEGKEPRHPSLVEAYNIVTDSIFGISSTDKDAKEIALKYARDIEEVANAYAAQEMRRKVATVTAIIQHRLDPTHTIQDTKKFLIELTDAIYALANSDQADESKNKANPPSEEDLGKLQEENGKTTQLTGQKSSTNLPATTQASSPAKPSIKK